jgi:hypothetical protein
LSAEDSEIRQLKEKLNKEHADKSEENQRKENLLKNVEDTYRAFQEDLSRLSSKIKQQTAQQIEVSKANLMENEKLLCKYRSELEGTKREKHEDVEKFSAEIRSLKMQLDEKENANLEMEN